MTAEGVVLFVFAAVCLAGVFYFGMSQPGLAGGMLAAAVGTSLVANWLRG